MPTISQSSLMAFFLLAGFIIFIVQKNQLAAWRDVVGL